MGLFSKRAGARNVVPQHVLQLLPDFGSASLSARARGGPVTDARFDWPAFLQPVMTACTNDPGQVLDELMTAASNNTLAMFGAYSLFAEFDPSSQDPRFLALQDAALETLHTRRFSSGHLTGHEASRWIQTHGDLRTSFDHIEDVVPASTDRAVTFALGYGEGRMVAAMGPGDRDNRFYVERRHDGSYGAFSMRPRSSDDSTMSRCEEPEIGTSNSVQGVLARLGKYLRERPYYADENLEPYFTERRT